MPWVKCNFIIWSLKLLFLCRGTNILPCWLLRSRRATYITLKNNDCCWLSYRISLVLTIKTKQNNKHNSSLFLCLEHILTLLFLCVSVLLEYPSHFLLCHTVLIISFCKLLVQTLLKRLLLVQWLFILATGCCCFIKKIFVRSSVLLTPYPAFMHVMCVSVFYYLEMPLP